MSNLNIARPKLTSETVIKYLDNNYRLNGTISSLPSERDQNFLLTLETGDKYICKIASSNEKEENLILQNSLIKHLKKKLPNSTAGIIPDQSGKEINIIEDQVGTRYYFRLLTYIEGSIFAKYTPHSDKILYSLGEFIAELTVALSDFKSDIPKWPFDWDLETGLETITKHKKHIQTQEQQDLITYYSQLFRINYNETIKKLDQHLIHGDANDYNLVISHDILNSGIITWGIIDFGDIQISCTIGELAITIAYAILDKPNPFQVIIEIVRGYNHVKPLSDLEMQILYQMILMRLCISVSMSAYQKQMEPDNQYLVISEKPAWNTLKRLKQLPKNLVYYAIRSVCDLHPHPRGKKIEEWMNHYQFAPILDGISNYTILDLSFESLQIAGLHSVEDFAYYNHLIKSMLVANELVIGRYAEPRQMYIHPKYQEVNGLSESYRTIHLGLDLFVKEGKSVHSPMEGIIHAITRNAEPFVNGHSIVIQYKTLDEDPFFILFGHLSGSSIENKQIGQEIDRAEEIGTIANQEEIGAWIPHLHLQLILDPMDLGAEIPGVTLPEEQKIWMGICPDPNRLVKFDIPPTLQKEAIYDSILAKRMNLLSPSLSVSYDPPLHIVRGSDQYLYSYEGHRYLDCVNNVPTVGHSNPIVVKALANQASVLNTNTRYLQKPLVNYAEKLLSYFPEPLKVCFFVNSGSEANELAIRLAKAYTQGTEFIVLDHAYHGNTNQAIELSPYKFNGKGGFGKPDNTHIAPMPYPYRGKYRGPDSGINYAGDVKEIITGLENNGKKLCAFIAESLPGVGGQIVFPDNFLKLAYGHTREVGGICIADEVQVGFARMGTHYWGFETQEVIPDIVTLGKPIGNGHPMGAVITTQEIATAFHNGMEFFSTTGGNTVSASVGLSVLEVIESENLQANAKKVGNHLLNLLYQLQKGSPVIGEVRGIGLFIGIEIVKDREQKIPAPELCRYIITEMKRLNVLLSSDGPDNNVIKIKPPLIFTRENAEELVSKLRSVLSHTAVELSYSLL